RLDVIGYTWFFLLFVSIIYMHLHVFGTHTKTIHSELLESLNFSCIMLHTLFSFVIIIYFVWHLTHFILSCLGVRMTMKDMVAYHNLVQYNKCVIFDIIGLVQM
ncbi:hypothetical protein ACJX0J_026265, partial [Zea mays]